jgi:hypothetical protein
MSTERLSDRFSGLKKVPAAFPNRSPFDRSGTSPQLPRFATELE